MAHDYAMSLFEYAREQHGSPAAPTPQNPRKVDAAPPQEACRILDVLADRRGADRAVTAPDIAAAAGLWPEMSRADRGTRAREVITAWYEHLQLPGHVLIAGSSGYYHTDDPAEITRYAQSLRSRALKILDRHSRFGTAAKAAGFTREGKSRWVRY